MIHLAFEQTHIYNYPVYQTGGATAMTVCRRGGNTQDLASGEPLLAFLTQNPEEDLVSYLYLLYDYQQAQHILNTTHEQVSGFGYNPFTKDIWCGSGFESKDKILAFDPASHATNVDFDLPVDQDRESHLGFATNGFFMVLSHVEAPTTQPVSRLDFRLMNGVKIGEKRFVDRHITGLTASPWSWTFCDRQNHELVVINPLGEQIASCPAPGPQGNLLIPLGEGISAIAFDGITNQSQAPQVGLHWQSTHPVVPGSVNHPDTPWDPEPWTGRHRVYIANDTNQHIYAGYFYQP